jgi:DNA (cytosine-5)-methyltransferase 1
LLKVLSLFSGIGAFEKALSRQQIEYELVNYCEIDKYASKAYSVIHNEPESKNLGDITKVDENKLPDFDLMTWGFPCTDISVAGKQAGIVQGETRSGLYYEGLRILKSKLPKYSIIENVKALTGNKFKDQFQQMLSDLENCGYRNHWKVLNAKDYGIPQNRERVFVISIRNDINCDLDWPKQFDNGLRLRDLLEQNVDEKYYISEDKTQKLLNSLREDYGNKDVTVPCITPDRVEKRQM